jgi:hypothetical protein
MMGQILGAIWFGGIFFGMVLATVRVLIIFDYASLLSWKAIIALPLVLFLGAAWVMAIGFFGTMSFMLL